MKNLTRSEFLKHLDGEIRRAEKTLADWKQTLNDSPSYAMTWSQKAFDAVVVLEECQLWKATLEKYTDIKVEDVIIRLKDLVLKSATYCERSTSVPSNLMERSMLACRAELIRELECRFC